MKLSVIVVSVLLLGSCVFAVDNGLGRTPQMAWNSWNAMGCNINETLIRNIAQAMVKTGLAAVGYEYVNIDDCWQISRDASGNIVADSKLFPSGIKALADYVHSLGLKFGLYSDAGSKTCQGRPGSLGYEVQDAKQYAAWGVDYLKYDNCNNENLPDLVRYPPMRDALNATGRRIFYSLCDWVVTTAVWGPQVGNSWRTTTDIYWRYESWVSNIDQNNAIAGYASPGGWNDPDMLEVGNGPTQDENIAHFSLWSIAKAPLILGNDLTRITTAVTTILTNKEVIAVNQDPLGRQGVRVAHDISSDPKIFGNLVFVDDCKGLSSQLWTYSNSTKRIESRHVAGQCIGQYARNWECTNPSQGAQLYMQPCGTAEVECKGTTQQWDFSSGLFRSSFSSSNNHLCVEVVENSDSEVMIGWTCIPAPYTDRQKWTVKSDGTIVNTNGKCLTVSSGAEVWAVPLADGSHAAVLFNRASVAQKVTVNFSALKLTGSFAVRDLWAGRDLGSFTTSYAATVNSHGAAMITIKK